MLSPRSEMFAGLRVGAEKEKPLWPDAEKVRKAKGSALELAAWSMASFEPGTAEIAAVRMHCRSSGEAEAPAFTMATTASGFAAMAALMIRSISRHSVPGFVSEFLTAALIATAAIFGASSGRSLAAAMT